jgi:phosphatidylserine decarboxylase
MCQISSVNFEETVVPGAEVRKGDPLGFFLFGGSDIVMIFQKGVSLELLSEKHVMMGAPYAEIDS